MRGIVRSLAVLAFAAPVVMRAQVIDQNAPTNNVIMASFFQTNLAQSFKQSAGNISGAGIFLNDGTGNATLTIRLWDLLPSAVGANMLATGSTAFNGSNAWVDVFWSPVGIVAGQTYFLEFLSTSSVYNIGGDLNDGYAGGQTYANSGFASFPNFDYTFRTYANRVSVVPEPGTVSLMLGGLLALGVVTWRRRR